MRWAGHVARMGDTRVVYESLAGRCEGKRHLGRPRRRRANISEIDLKEAGWKHMIWIDMAQDRDRWWALVNAVMKLKVA